MIIVFVDDEPEVLKGIERAARISEHYKSNEFHFFSNSNAALKFLTTHPVDVVVSDFKMPLLDGPKFLKDVIKLRPQAIRFMLSGEASGQDVASIVSMVHQYFQKPTDINEIIIKAINIINNRTVISKAITDEIAATLKIKTLPDTYKILHEMLQKTSTTIEDIAKIIERDMALASKILAITNSAFYGLKQFSSVTDSVSYLGLETICNLVLINEIFNQYPQDFNSKYQLQKIWHSSYKLGNMCSLLNKMIKGVAATDKTSYNLGLFKYLGIVYLLEIYGDDYYKVLTKGDGDICDEEMLQFNLNHKIVSAYLLNLWNFPQVLLDTYLTQDDSTYYAALLKVAENLSPPSFKNSKPIKALDIRHQKILGINDWDKFLGRLETGTGGV